MRGVVRSQVHIQRAASSRHRAGGCRVPRVLGAGDAIAHVLGGVDKGDEDTVSAEIQRLLDAYTPFSASVS